MFLEISQNSQENICARASFLIKLNRCFRVNFAKFLRIPFLQNTSGRLLLRIHITFSITSVKIKISLPLYFFTRTKFIYLKRTVSFFSNHGTLKKIKIRGFGEKKYGTLGEKIIEEGKGRTSSFSYENYRIRILTFCSLKMCL